MFTGKGKGKGKVRSGEDDSGSASSSGSEDDEAGLMFDEVKPPLPFRAIEALYTLRHLRTRSVHSVYIQ
jgi:hypothetical protein